MSAKYYGTEKVGETFEYNGKKYKVMANMANRGGIHPCLDCVFYDGKVAGCYEMACAPFFRDNKSSVYYQEVDQ